LYASSPCRFKLLIEKEQSSYGHFLMYQILAILFIVVVKSASGAPQEAAGSAMALCLAVIPHVIALTASELKK